MTTAVRMDRTGSPEAPEAGHVSTGCRKKRLSSETWVRRRPPSATATARSWRGLPTASTNVRSPCSTITSSRGPEHVRRPAPDDESDKLFCYGRHARHPRMTPMSPYRTSRASRIARSRGSRKGRSDRATPPLGPARKARSPANTTKAGARPSRLRLPAAGTMFGRHSLSHLTRCWSCGAAATAVPPVPTSSADHEGIATCRRTS